MSQVVKKVYIRPSGLNMYVQLKLTVCQASNFSFTLAQWAMARASGHSAKYKRNKLRLAQGKQNLRAAFPNDKLEFKCFSSPGTCTCMLGGRKYQFLG